VNTRTTPTTTAATTERPRREPELTFLRLVPGDTPIHRLWAGTKVLVATELMFTATFAPTWLTLAVIAVLVLAALLIGRIPLGAFPRLPLGFWYLILLGLVLSSWSTMEPIVHLGPLPVSLGALAVATRLLALAIVLVLSAAVVGWTTPLGAIAPALSRLARPFRALRLPVDEWIVAIAVALRCLPLLVDEMRTLAAARRLRHRPPDDESHQTRRALVEIHDLIATAIIVSLRRAHDLADAMNARGGVGVISDAQDAPRTWRDAVTLAGATAISVALIVVALL
jgi:energy-coupling factor transport system permease protein